MEKQLVYLACPYSHDEARVRLQRFRAVNVAAATLMAEGVYVYSPISHTHPIAEAGGLPLGFDFWEGYDRAIISACRALVVLKLDGWEESTGVQSEIEIAGELGIPVEYMEPLPVEGEQGLSFSYTPETDVIMIEGIKYSGVLFRMFSSSTFAPGTKLEIVKRENDLVTVRRLR